MSEQAGQHDGENDSVQHTRDSGLLGELLTSPVNLEHATSRLAARQGRLVNDVAMVWDAQIRVAHPDRTSGYGLRCCRPWPEDEDAVMNWPPVPRACYYVELTALPPTHL